MTRESQSDTADREMVITRLIDAPREVVFKVWTSPDHIEQWWGPNGFTTTTHEIDVRPGGTWRYVMRGPDGTDYPNRIDFREIVEPERLVYDHSGDSPEDTTRFQTTVTFEDRDGKTAITMRALFETAAMRDQVVREYGAIEGARQTLARLAGLVENTVVTTDAELIIARTFDAPRDLVFKCWTEPEHFARWWGPQGFETPSCRIDARPGGSALFNMRSPASGIDMWYGRDFHEVTSPSRLVFTEYMADAEGARVSPAGLGMGDSWPGEMRNVIDFLEHEGKTTMVIRVELPASVPGREYALGGYNQAFEKLGTYLTEQPAR